MEVKKETTFEEQLEKIKSRGCIIGDETFALQVLKRINYYRLKAKTINTLMVQLLTKYTAFMSLTENSAPCFFR